MNESGIELGAAHWSHMDMLPPQRITAGPVGEEEVDVDCVDVINDDSCRVEVAGVDGIVDTGIIGSITTVCVYYK
jgi:hypothetical protein